MNGEDVYDELAKKKGCHGPIDKNKGTMHIVNGINTRGGGCPYMNGEDVYDELAIKKGCHGPINKVTGTMHIVNGINTSGGDRYYYGHDNYQRPSEHNGGYYRGGNANSSQKEINVENPKRKN